MTTPDVSVVVPCHDEAGNLRQLVDEIRAALEPLGVAWELVVTDDASTDDSWAVLVALARQDPRVRVRRFATNCGESAASWAGMQAARAPVVVTLDADLQNDPAEIPRFLAALHGADCVCGTRVAARAGGDGLVKVLSSRIANAVRRRLGGGAISDAGCTYRALRRACLANVRCFRGVHRFLPTLLAIDGFRVVEIPIANRPRGAGRSHYGIRNRAVPAFVDLLAVRWMRSRAVRWEIRTVVEAPADQGSPPSTRITAPVVKLDASDAR